MSEISMESSQSCPCGSGNSYRHCCCNYHSGELYPATAEALMRSRYTAYVLKNADYLLGSWSPKTRPVQIDFSMPAVNWSGLEIIAIKKGTATDDKGMISFKAFYKADGKDHVMNEVSRFSKIAGRWYYVDGIVKENHKSTSRNSLCPCGSGKKYKRCCGES
jgi:SEC-C motif-containing protein